MYVLDKNLFPKIVVVIVDALKYDMLFSKQNFPYLHKLKFLKFMSIAHTPTVTLPRIKVSLF